MKQEYIARREKLLSLLNKSSCLFVGNRTTYRDSFVTNQFCQESNFIYFSGICEKDCFLLLNPTALNQRSVLFIPNKDPFKELWEGKSLDANQIKQEYHFDEVFYVEELFPYLKRLKEKDLIVNFPKEFYLQNEISNNLKEIGLNIKPFSEIKPTIEQMRLIKNDFEINQIKQACAITAKAHNHIIKNRLNFESEYDALVEFDYICKTSGCVENAYPPIFAAGSNALFLHYGANSSKLKKNDLFLIDYGYKYNNYCADITRTFPIREKFSCEQKELYNLVLSTLKESINYIPKATRFSQLHKFAVNYLSQSLIDMGILNKFTLEEIITKKIYREFLPHSIGHSMGLDVHDLCPQDFALDKGVCITVEPGIYIREDNPYVPESMKSIGIRIEDNILISDDEICNLTINAFKEVKELEL